MRAEVIMLTMLAAVTSAVAEDAGCSKFAWSLPRERTLFAAADKPRVLPGAEFVSIPSTAIVVRLQPAAQAGFVMPPERQAKSEDWFGGMLRLPGGTAGPVK
jgi:hypothetical protein